MKSSAFIVNAFLAAAVLAVGACGKHNASSGAADPKGSGSAGEAITATTTFDRGGWNPEEQFEGLRNMPAEERGAQLAKLYYRWGSDADQGLKAVSHAEAHGSAMAGAALREAFRGWLSADDEGAKHWVGLLSDGRRRTKLAAALSAALPNSAARAEWANGFSGSDTGRTLMSRVLAEWAREDPQSGLTWLESEGNPETLRDETGQLIRSWVDQDSVAASEWIAEMEEGEMRDAAVRALATVVGADEPGAARQWAETISDKDQRATVLALLEKISGGSAGLPPVAGDINEPQAP